MFKRLLSLAMFASIALGSALPASANYPYVPNNPFIQFIPDPGSCVLSPCTFTDATWLNTIAQNVNSIEQGYMQAQNLLNGPTLGQFSSSGVKDPGLATLLQNLQTTVGTTNPQQQWMAIASLVAQNGATNKDDLGSLLNVMEGAQGSLSVQQIEEVATQKIAGGIEMQNQMQAYQAIQAQANTARSYVNAGEVLDVGSNVPPSSTFYY